jgi:hypothetical protein
VVASTYDRTKVGKRICQFWLLITAIYAEKKFPHIGFQENRHFSRKIGENRRKYWDRCYDFLNIFDEKFGVFLLKLLLVFAKIVCDHSIGF